MPALLEKLLEIPRAESPEVLWVVCRGRVVPRGVTGQRDDENAERCGIAATGSPNASVAKPRSPSLHTLSGDLCVDTRISQRWAAISRCHSLCLFFPSTCSMMAGESGTAFGMFF